MQIVPDALSRPLGLGVFVGQYGDIPPGLPALWVALGQGDRAESLTYFIADRDSVLASARLASVLAATGKLDQAERLVRSIRFWSGQARDEYGKAWAWTDLAWLAIISGDRDRSGRLIREAYSEARSVTQPYLQAQLLLAWARVRAANSDGPGAGEVGDRAWGLVTGKLDKPALGQWVLEALPVIVTGSGDLDRAEEFVRAVPG